MFPPLITTAHFFPLTLTAPDKTAASPAAPAGSARVFALSSRRKIAFAISASLTRTTPSRYLFSSLSVIFPGSFTAIPSARVSLDSILPTLPCPSALYTVG